MEHRVLSNVTWAFTGLSATLKERRTGSGGWPVLPLTIAMPLPDLPLSMSSPQALAAWHTHARTMPTMRLPALMNPLSAHTIRDSVSLAPVLQAALVWDVHALSDALRAVPSPTSQELSQALGWAMDAQPTVLRTVASGIQMPVRGTWAPGMTEARDVVIELLLGHGAHVQGPALVQALSDVHGPAVLARLLQAPVVDHRIPLTMGRHDTVLHVATRLANAHDTVPRLVQAGGDLNHWALSNNLKARTPDRPHHEMLSPLGVAASQGDLVLCQLLLDLGADPQRAAERPGGMGGVAERFGHPTAVAQSLRVLGEQTLLQRAFSDVPIPNDGNAPGWSRARL